MKTIQYHGTANIQEKPITGNICLWYEGLKDEIEDSRADALIAYSSDFRLDSDPETDNVVKYQTDPVTGGITGLVGTNGIVMTFGGVANTVKKPALKHFFACDRLQSNGLVDVVGGLTLTPANNVLSVVAPEYVTVAAASSGNLTLSDYFNLAGNKPFYIMALYSNTASGGFGGFHFDNAGVAGVGAIELWNGTTYSTSLVADGATSTIDGGYADGAGTADVAVGILFTPGVGVDFFYAGPASFWQNNSNTTAPLSSISRITKTCASIANPTNGVRKIHGIIVYEFDSKPSDWKAATIEMRTNWLAGIKTPYVGW